MRAFCIRKTNQNVTQYAKQQNNSALQGMQARINFAQTEQSRLERSNKDVDFNEKPRAVD